MSSVSDAFLRSSATFPVVLMILVASFWRTAIPALSYPRYSKRSRPPIKISASCNLPVNPIIPHIIKISLFNFRKERRESFSCFLFNFCSHFVYIICGFARIILPLFHGHPWVCTVYHIDRGYGKASAESFDHFPPR